MDLGACTRQTYRVLRRLGLRQAPQGLPALNSLEHLDLSYNPLGASNLSPLSTLRALRKLDLSFTQLRVVPGRLLEGASLEVRDKGGMRRSASFTLAAELAVWRQVSVCSVPCYILLYFLLGSGCTALALSSGSLLRPGCTACAACSGSLPRWFGLQIFTNSHAGLLLLL